MSDRKRVFLITADDLDASLKTALERKNWATRWSSEVEIRPNLVGGTV